MDIMYFKVSAYGKEFFGIPGVKENGGLVSFEFTSKDWKEIEDTIGQQLCLSLEDKLNVFENGAITISSSSYNAHSESWNEETLYEFSGELKEKMQKHISIMLSISPICRDRDNLRINNYNELIEFIKNY